ncbi:GSK-3-binding protein FRAT2-like, partial [Cricetulus griseus]|uniref:GSK-3-binding protein FRAT2-like n=1 Tax=Cricetulus griseus TaxID=10029 RepID=UPI0004540E3A
EAGFEAEGEDKDDSFLLLQQSVTLGSLTDVDQLIAKIGKSLKLDTAHNGPASPSAAPRPPPLRIQAAISVDQNRSPARQMLGSSVSAETVAPAHPGAILCILWERGRLWSRAAPYCVEELTAGTSALCP